jgi:hypothetical protein
LLIKLKVKQDLEAKEMQMELLKLRKSNEEFFRKSQESLVCKKMESEKVTVSMDRERSLQPDIRNSFKWLIGGIYDVVEIVTKIMELRTYCSLPTTTYHHHGEKV